MQNTDAKPQADGMELALDAFRLTWLHFPHPVLLLRADRTILEVNEVALGRGGRPGAKCYEISGRQAICPHCRADVALHEQMTKRWIGQSKDKFFFAYWIPMQGAEDVYVHFAIDITDHVRPELMRPYI